MQLPYIKKCAYCQKNINLKKIIKTKPAGKSSCVCKKSRIDLKKKFVVDFGLVWKHKK